MNISNLALLIFIFVFSSASAQELIGMKIEPAEITVGQPVEIIFELKGQQNNGVCGLLVDFGDGSSQHIRVEEEKLPLKVTHTYDKVGNYALSADGKMMFRGFSSALACSGSMRTAAVNVREEDFAVKEAAEQAAKEAAFNRAAAERRAAERAAEIAAAERLAAERAAQKAAADRAAAEKAAASGARARAAAEKEAARSAASQRTAKKASADRSAAEQPASGKGANEPVASRPQLEVEAPKKAAPVKARSAMDL